MNEQPVTVGIGDVEETIEAVLDALRPLQQADWTQPAGQTSWTCRAVLAHLADDLVVYAAQLATGATSAYVPLTVGIDETADTATALQALRAAADLFIAVLRISPPSASGWHPYGMADAEATAAMGIVELLVHTHDICQGLDTTWAGPRRPTVRALQRLFPDVTDTIHATTHVTVDVDVDPWRTLLWATGRVDLPGRARRTSWRWHNQPS